MTVKTYKIAGVVFEQRPLLFLTDRQAKAIIKKHVGNLGETEEQFATAFDKMYETDGVAELFTLILTLAHLSPIKKWWNERASRRKNVVPATVLSYMTKQEVAQVVVDFFVLRQEWKKDFVSSLIRTASSRPKKPSWMESMSSRLTSSRTTSPVATLK